MPGRQVIVFDLDDTLVDTSHVYWQAREYFVQELVAEGIEAQVAVEEFEKVDSQLIRSLGFSPLRYGRSMTLTFERLMRKLGRYPSEQALSRIESFGRYVLDHPPELIDGARALLQWATRNFDLALLTRGDEELQKWKVEQVGLSEYFSAVRVVSKKDAKVFRTFLAALGHSPEKAWVVGDSIRSDINPGLEIGAKCILYLYRHPSYRWRQEHGDHAVKEHYEANTLYEVKDILESSLRLDAAIGD